MTLSPRSCWSTSPATVAPDNQRGADLGAVAADHQHLAEFNHLAGLGRDAVDPDDIFRGDAVLLAARFDDCEHLSFLRVRTPMLGPDGPDRLFVSRFIVLLERLGSQEGAQSQTRGPFDPRAGWLWGAGAPFVKKGEGP